MTTARSLDQTIPKRKARLRGLSPDGAEIVIGSDGELEIIGGDSGNYNNLIRIGKVYLAVIKENGYDISNLNQEEFAEINGIIRELKEQNQD